MKYNINKQCDAIFTGKGQQKNPLIVSMSQSLIANQFCTIKYTNIYPVAKQI